MRCYAEARVRHLAAVVVLAAAAAPAGAQSSNTVSGEAELRASADVAEARTANVFVRRVADAIAARWGIAADAVRVEPSSPAVSWPADDASFTLTGSGADGLWLLDIADGTTTSRMIVRSGVESRSPVASHDLERGATLAQSDIAWQSVVRWGPPRRSDPIAAGWVARRRITRGESLEAPAVAPPLAVRPGETVRIVFEHAGITITLAGRAAGQASIGERVAVRAETGKRLEGIVTGAGVVRVGTSGST